jgi:hypothetical protein
MIYGSGRAARALGSAIVRTSRYDNSTGRPVPRRTSQTNGGAHFVSSGVPQLTFANRRYLCGVR